MNPDTICLTASVIIIVCVCLIIACAAYRVDDPWAYIGPILIMILAGFVAATQPA